MVTYGAYTQLLLAAQADDDPVHRQQAMDFLAVIGPMAGSTAADGSCPGDTLAAPMLAALYPPPQPDPPAGSPADIQARLAPILEDYRQQALAIVRSWIPGGTGA